MISSSEAIALPSLEEIIRNQILSDLQFHINTLLLVSHNPRRNVVLFLVTDLFTGTRLFQASFTLIG